MTKTFDAKAYVQEQKDARNKAVHRALELVALLLGIALFAGLIILLRMTHLHQGTTIGTMRGTSLYIVSLTAGLITIFLFKLSQYNRDNYALPLLNKISRKPWINIGAVLTAAFVLIAMGEFILRYDLLQRVSDPGVLRQLPDGMIADALLQGVSITMLYYYVMVAAMLILATVAFFFPASTALLRSRKR